MQISSLPIPKELADLIRSLGYDTLYPTQEEAVKAGVLEGKSMLLATPTASGKTLVALLAAGKLLLEDGGKVVYLTPLRALAYEKYEEFKSLESLFKSDGTHLRVLISTGDYDSTGESLGIGDVIVLTNEKFDSILRHGASWIDSVKLFIADEIHLVGNVDRGPTLEAILTKTLAFAPEAQIIALSATVTNSKDLAEWLHTSLVDVDWRPISLLEGVYEYGEIAFTDGSRRHVPSTGRGAVIDVATEVLPYGGQSLIFAETRRRAVSIALKASEVTPNFLSNEEAASARRAAKEISETGEETELSRLLSKVVEKGSAWHHAGLSSTHRRIVEDFFRKGVIKILTATPTLAAGVNLPARRVVLSSVMRYDAEYGGQAPITVLEYKQMCLPYSSRVLLEDGTREKIGKIVEKRLPVRVLSFDPHALHLVAKRVTNWFRRRTRSLVEIQTTGGLALTVTLEHPLLVREGKWVRAGDIRPGDLVAYIRKFDYETDPANLYFHKYVPAAGSYLANKTDLFEWARSLGTRRELAAMLRKDLKAVKEYVRGKKSIPYDAVLKVCRLLRLADEEISRIVTRVKPANGTPIEIPRHVTPEFMWLVGIVLSDGNIKRSLDKRSGSVTYLIRIFNNNTKIISKACQVLRSFGLKPRIQQRLGSSYVVNVGSSILAQILHSFGVPYGKKMNAKIPDFVFSLPKELISSLLLGIFDGDGNYLSARNYPSVRRVLITTASHRMANDIHNLLLRLGIVSEIRPAKVKPTIIRGKPAMFSRRAFNVIFRKIRDIQQFTSYGQPVKYSISVPHYSKYHNMALYYESEQALEWLEVLSVRNMRKMLNVYNISVEDTGTFTADNFVVHNCGRAGRPKYDTVGETVLISSPSFSSEELVGSYIEAQPEPIKSQLVREGALRSHTLATIATLPGITEDELRGLFGKTLFAKQFTHLVVRSALSKALNYLEEEALVRRRKKRFVATEFGKRLSTLYIDPATGVTFRRALQYAVEGGSYLAGYLHLIASTSDFAPRFPLRQRDREEAALFAKEHENELIIPMADPWDFDDYFDYLSDFRAVMVMYAWIDELGGDKIYDKFGVEPGDLYRAIDNADWLLYSLSEVSRLLGRSDLLKDIAELRERVRYGVRPEVLPLTRLEGIGRVRARALYNAGFTDTRKLASTSVEALSRISKIGPAIARKIKEQLSSGI